MRNSNIQYKITFECTECGRTIEKFAKNNHSCVRQGECQGCGERDVYFDRIDYERVDRQDVPGVEA